MLTRLERWWRDLTLERKKLLLFTFSPTFLLDPRFLEEFSLLPQEFQQIMAAHFGPVEAEVETA